MQILSMPDTPIFQGKYKNRTEGQPHLTVIACHFDLSCPSALFPTPTNCNNQKLFLFNGESTYIKGAIHTKGFPM